MKLGIPEKLEVLDLVATAGNIQLSHTVEIPYNFWRLLVAPRFQSSPDVQPLLTVNL